MSISSSNSDTRSSSQQIDTAENFEKAAASNILNLNLAGSKFKGTSGGGKKEGGGSSNSGVILNTLDGNAISGALAFAERINQSNVDTTSRTIDVLSTQLTKDRAAQLAPNTEAGNTITKVIFALVAAGIIAIGLKAAGKK